jgi:hypothetical protein
MPVKHDDDKLDDSSVAWGFVVFGVFFLVLFALCCGALALLLFTARCAWEAGASG